MFKIYFREKLFHGIEIKCTYQKRTIEVLGYKIDTKKMNKWMKDFYKDKQKKDLQLKYFNMLYEKCKKLNYVLPKKDEIKWNPETDWASFTIYSELKKINENKEKMPNDMWENFSGFNRKYCNDPNHILYIDKSKDYPTFEQTISVIKECGGLVFMPHMFIYKWVEDKKKFIENIVENYDIDGLECYYTDFSKEETTYMVELCKKKKLYMSGGSDYHGLNKERISLAKGYGNLKIEKDIIKDWMEEE